MRPRVHRSSIDFDLCFTAERSRLRRDFLREISTSQPTRVENPRTASSFSPSFVKNRKGLRARPTFARINFDVAVPGGRGYTRKHNFSILLAMTRARIIDALEDLSPRRRPLFSRRGELPAAVIGAHPTGLTNPRHYPAVVCSRRTFPDPSPITSPPSRCHTVHAIVYLVGHRDRTAERGTEIINTTVAVPRRDGICGETDQLMLFTYR